MESGKRKLEISLHPSNEASFSKFLSHQSGCMFEDEDDLLVNKDCVRIVSQNEDESPPLIKPSDNQLSLADLEILKVVGKGNSGIVHLVRNKWTGKLFSLKVIQVNSQEDSLSQIAKELKITQSAQCPYIVACFQSFYDQGAISIIMEYMDGGSLEDFLKKVKTIPEPYLAAIFKQVLKGLIYLHNEKRIIHRDIKPSNLLINHSGEVKITDFGVCAILETTSAKRDTFVGTYNYMSPERISGGRYGHKSDIWSLGLVLLECATGRFPYSPPEQDEGWTNVYELMEAIVDQPSPCAPSDQFSPEFCSFISTCLQKDPKDRQTAHELMEHPFISMYEDLHVDLASYFNEGSTLTTFSMPIRTQSGTFGGEDLPVNKDNARIVSQNEDEAKSTTEEAIEYCFAQEYNGSYVPLSQKSTTEESLTGLVFHKEDTKPIYEDKQEEEIGAETIPRDIIIDASPLIIGSPQSSPKDEVGISCGNIIAPKSMLRGFHIEQEKQVSGNASQTHFDIPQVSPKKGTNVAITTVEAIEREMDRNGKRSDSTNPRIEPKSRSRRCCCCCCQFKCFLYFHVGPME